MCVRERKRALTLLRDAICVYTYSQSRYIIRVLRHTNTLRGSSLSLYRYIHILSCRHLLLCVSTCTGAAAAAVYVCDCMCCVFTILMMVGPGDQRLVKNIAREYMI